MTFTKRLISNSFLKRSLNTIFLRGGGIVLSFMMLLLITNFFPDDIVGKYQYFNAILIIAGTIALLGMNVSFIRFSGELFAMNQAYLLRNLYFKNVIILLITSSIIILFYFIIKLYLPEVDQKVYQWVLMALFPNCLLVLNFQVLLGLKKLYLSEFFRNIIKFIILIISITGFYFFWGTSLLLQSFVLGLWVIAFLSTWFVFKILKFNQSITQSQIKNKPSISFQKIIRISTPMALSYISLLLMQQMDLLILKRFTAYNEIAYYGVAVKISVLLSIILTAINQVIGTKITEQYYRKDKQELINTIDKSIILNNVLVIPIVFIIYLFPETILGFFGENYGEAKVALLILIAGQAVNAFAGSTDLYLNMTGKQQFFQKIIFGSMLLNLVLNFFLIPLYGMTGAALATAISLVLWNILGVIYVWNVDKIILILNFTMLKKILNNEK